MAAVLVFDPRPLCGDWYATTIEAFVKLPTSDFDVTVTSTRLEGVFVSPAGDKFDRTGVARFIHGCLPPTTGNGSGSLSCADC